MRIGPAAGIIGANTRTPVATMSTLTVPNVSPEMLALLRDRAARSGRTVEEELLSAADQTLRVVDVSAPEELHPIPNQEISAPFDLELEGPWERVVARDGGPPQLEFWFDEDKRFG